MAFLEPVVKVKGRSMKLSDPRNVFSAYGDTIYPSRNSCSSDDSQCFNEFNERDSSERALRLDNGSATQVVPVSMDAILAEECQSALRGGSDSSRHKESSRNNLQNIPMLDGVNQTRHYPSRITRIRGSVLNPSTNFIHAPDLGKPELDTLMLDNLSNDETTSPSSMSALDSSEFLLPVARSLPHSQSHETPEAAVPSLTYINSPNAADFLTVPCIPLTTHIRMCFCGELFSYDLNHLKSDPREIIELMKWAGSERGNWMMVGASYRRQGNPHAAIAVLQSMLEVMTRHGMSERELKPAFLLLSGCEFDLSKLTQDEGRIALEHQQRARKWLQKVYGATKSQSDNIDVVAPSTDPQLGLPARPSFPSHSDAQNLRREMQSLRDRLSHQVRLLADVRSAKRKIEGSYNLERHTRRRLEREIKDLKAERCEARRM
ncbi:hypothetical protein J3R30DRAFT_3698062 [Lentinula aciculospora]|uniref:Uncharacterized protein n=1 Tax=Lentinula aciculospora TaxID=153920 RepID=A0A9W9AI60_9AGAR|nr:hypothetical protein J3R30DRAFT_3698062 [Lentinula aciculospora]